MRYLFAILLPPVAVLSCGRPISALLNIPLCILAWVPGVIHAMLIVGQHHGDKRNDKIIKAVASGRQ